MVLTSFCIKWNLSIDIIFWIIYIECHYTLLNGIELAITLIIQLFSTYFNIYSMFRIVSGKPIKDLENTSRYSIIVTNKHDCYFQLYMIDEHLKTTIIHFTEDLRTSSNVILLYYYSSPNWIIMKIFNQQLISSLWKLFEWLFEFLLCNLCID